MVGRGCARGRTRGNIAGEHVARFRQTDPLLRERDRKVEAAPGAKPRRPRLSPAGKVDVYREMFNLGGQIVNRANLSTVLQAIMRSG